MTDTTGTTETIAIDRLRWDVDQVSKRLERLAHRTGADYATSPLRRMEVVEGDIRQGQAVARRLSDRADTADQSLADVWGVLERMDARLKEVDRVIKVGLDTVSAIGEGLDRLIAALLDQGVIDDYSRVSGDPGDAQGDQDVNAEDYTPRVEAQHATITPEAKVRSVVVEFDTGEALTVHVNHP